MHLELISVLRVLGVFGVCYFLIRDLMLVRYCFRVIDHVAKLIDADTQAGRASSWRWEAFYETSFLRMLLTFWRPVDYWYKGKAFLKEHQGWDAQSQREGTEQL